MSYTPPSMLWVTHTGAWAKPGWMEIVREAETNGRLGPADTEELYNDYALLALADQAECGVDLVTDGETRRFGWIQRLAARLPGLRPQPRQRLLGAPGYDTLDTYVLEQPLEGLTSLWNFVEEFDFARAHTDRPVRMDIPGPFAMTTQLDFSRVYSKRSECAAAFVPAIRGDIQRLVAAGCRQIQLEQAMTPGVLADDRSGEAVARLINECIDGISGCVFTLHVCFGSFMRLPYAKRSYRPLFPALLEAQVQGFSLEFAAREMAEIEIVGEWDPERVLVAGLIDIKTHYAETPEDIAERVRVCLRYRAPERLQISSDCGFTRVPRYLCKRKLSAASAAAQRLRRELGDPSA